MRDPTEAFEVFHDANPHVYELFEWFTLQAIGAGRTRFGARMVWERMRWYTKVEARDRMSYKLNDHYPPFYARLFMRDHPQHAGLFETRTAIADDLELPDPANTPGRLFDDEDA